MILFILICVLLYICFIRKPYAAPNQLNVYFGVPGSGKTTFASYLVKRSVSENRIYTFLKKYDNRSCKWLCNHVHFKKHRDVYSNVPITGAYQLDPRNDIGVWSIEDAHIIIDEASIEFNNRDFKSFPASAIRYFKYHRHWGTAVSVFSQSFDDMDITLRRLAQHYYVVKKSILPFFIVVKKIRRKVGIDENTHQIVDYYSFGLPILDSKHVFSPPLWKLFNSYSHDNLPIKAWQLW